MEKEKKKKSCLCCLLKKQHHFTTVIYPRENCFTSLSLLFFGQINWLDSAVQNLGEIQLLKPHANWLSCQSCAEPTQKKKKGLGLHAQKDTKTATLGSFQGSSAPKASFMEEQHEFWWARLLRVDPQKSLRNPCWKRPKSFAVWLRRGSFLDSVKDSSLPHAFALAYVSHRIREAKLS